MEVVLFQIFVQFRFIIFCGFGVCYFGLVAFSLPCFGVTDEKYLLSYFSFLLFGFCLFFFFSLLFLQSQLTSEFMLMVLHWRRCFKFSKVHWLFSFQLIVGHLKGKKGFDPFCASLVVTTLSLKTQKFLVQRDSTMRIFCPTLVANKNATYGGIFESVC